MDLIKLSCIIFLVISAFALTESAVLLTENSQFKAPEENNHVVYFEDDILSYNFLWKC